uniref:Ig-like domain-containing protein n=1 Tax=Dicentrarchus labrax TaxID=13489 RepID=A0A8C4NX27_DICLA
MKKFGNPCIMLYCVSSGTLVVTQTPAVSAMEGETVNVSCCWTWTGKPERMTVDWLKNQTSVKIDIFSLTNHSQGSLRMDTSDCLNLTFMKISREDSGRYTCKASVEIPLLVEFEGNGTVITVTARENTKDHTNPPTADSSFLCCFICLKKLRTRAQQHTPGTIELSRNSTVKIWCLSPISSIYIPVHYD